MSFVVAESTAEADLSARGAPDKLGCLKRHSNATEGCGPPPGPGSLGAFAAEDPTIVSRVRCERAADFVESLHDAL